MAASKVYLLLLIVNIFLPSVTFRSKAIPASLIEYINKIGSTSQGSCLCEACMECICTVNKTQYVTDPSWAAVALQEFKDSDAKVATVDQLPDAPFDLTQPPGHPLLGLLTGTLEPLRHLKRYPERFVLKTTRFLLFDRFDFRLNAKVIHYNNEAAFKSLPVYEKIFIVIHGWLGSPGDVRYINLRHALLAYHRYINPAVVVIDWKEGAEFSHTACLLQKGISCVYEKAAANAILVGRQVGLVSYLLVNGRHIDAHQIHIIGFSLGAQVAHFAANWFTTLQKQIKADVNHQNIGRITGLDPSARHFQGFSGAHITKEDALFVDVIHTSSVMNEGSSVDTLLGLFGMSISVGTVDFYPNGGREQPRCPNNKGADMTCNHQAAIKYFIDSLERNINRNDFKSVPCESFAALPICTTRVYDQDFALVSTMGIDAQDSLGHGDHFLRYSGKSHKTFRMKRAFETYTKCPRNAEKRKRRVMNIPPSARTFNDHELCGLHVAHPLRSRVWKGTNVDLGQFPWTVGFLNTKIDVDGNYVPLDGQAFCTGSILSEHWILSAAHCLSTKPRFKNNHVIFIVYGVIDVRMASDNYLRWTFRDKNHVSGDQNYFPHDEFDKHCEDYDNDIALLRLDAPLPLPQGVYNGEYVNRVCFRTRPTFDECDPYQFSGFGIFEEKSIVPNYLLHKIEAARLKTIECEADNKEEDKESDWTRKWCGANPVFPYSGFCDGDSGGPAVVFETQLGPGGASRAFQVGVAMVAIDCAENERLTWITLPGGDHYQITVSDIFTDVGHYLPWIEKTMTNHA